MQYGDEATNKYLKWAEEIKSCLAYIEASIDFSDEDVPKDLIKDIKKISKRAQSEIDSYIETEDDNEILQAGIKIAIVGRPNSGKSSLINYLTNKNISIVSKKPGTTTDVLRSEKTYDGVYVTLTDTAGIRAAKDEIEKEGLKRTKKELETAHIRIFLGSNSEKNPFYGIDMTVKNNDIVVINKSDLKKQHKIKPNISISIKTNKKLNILEKKLKEKIKKLSSSQSGTLLNRERQKNHLIRASKALASIKGGDLEIISLHVRDALKSIDSITQETSNEDVLGVIFNKFCIGK